MNINLSTVCVCGNKILIRETIETVEENEEYEITYIHREIYRWQYNAATLNVIRKTPRTLA